MQKIKCTLRNQMLAAGLVILLPLLAQAAPGPDDFQPQHAQRAEMPRMGEEELPVPAFMRDLTLSEAQRDAVFVVLHNQMPDARQKQKAIRNASNELRELALSRHYEEAKARALAEKIAKDVMALSLLQAHTQQMLYALLDQGQRRQVAVMEMRGERDVAPMPSPNRPPAAERPASD